MKALITPRTTANTNAPIRVVLTPGNMYAANKITIVEIIHVFIMVLLYHMLSFGSN
jgi:hypothetical protein